MLAYPDCPGKEAIKRILLLLLFLLYHFDFWCCWAGNLLSVIVLVLVNKVSMLDAVSTVTEWMNRHCGQFTLAIPSWVATMSICSLAVFH